jgi:hypothetical protein
MNVLILGRNLAMMHMSAQPIVDAGHEITMVLRDEDAIEKLNTGGFGAFILGVAIEDASRIALKALIAKNNWCIKVLEPRGLMDMGSTLKALD